MPFFAIIAYDRPDAGTLRADTRPEHLAYLESHPDAQVMIGPMLDEAGKPTGSLLIVDFPNLAAAKAYAAGDPYAKAGLFASSIVTAWRKVLPK